MKDGFILIEVLLASAISAILGVVLFIAYYQSNKVAESVDNFIDVYSREELLQHQLERDISGAFTPAQAYVQDHPLQHIFMSENKNDMFSMLTCITSNPLTTYEGTKPRIVRVVYRLKEADPFTGKASYVLTRQESEILNMKTFEQTGASAIRAYDMIDGIKECKIEFRELISTKDRKEFEKKNVWRSEEEETKDQKEKKKIIRLPYAVVMKITLWDLQRKRERNFAIYIPVAINTITQYQNEEQKDQTPKKQEVPKPPLPTPEKQVPQASKGAPQAPAQKLLPTTTSVTQRSNTNIRPKISHAFVIPAHGALS